MRWKKPYKSSSRIVIFIPLATSALARARADWLYGINMTRAYTIRGRQAGYDGVLSVGRVQTPRIRLDCAT